MKTIERQYSEGYGVWYYPLQWVKDGGYYSAPICADDYQLEKPQQCYHVSIEKVHDKKYVVFAEDHNPEDFTGDASDATFRTLKEAKAFAQDFALDWIACETANLDNAIKQEYDSAETSINSSRPPALITQYASTLGETNLDYGGGKFDVTTEFLAQYGVQNAIYDPFNRSQEHNEQVLSKTYKTATICNVLNVIKEKFIRQNCILHCLEFVQQAIYISVYYDCKKQEGATSKGYQMHKPIDFYFQEIQEILPSNCTISKIKGGFIKIEKH